MTNEAKLRLFPFRMKHLNTFETDDFDMDVLWEEMEFAITRKGSRLSSLIDAYGVTRCIVGVHDVRYGVGEIELLKHKGFCKLQFHRISKNFINGFKEMYPDIRRLELYTDVKWEKGRKWAELLGFEYEGISKCHNYTMRDNHRFSRLYLEEKSCPQHSW